MDSDRAGGFTRRAMLTRSGGIAVVAAMTRAVAAEEESTDASPRFKKMTQVQAEFERLLPLWQEERKQFAYSSNTTDYWKGPHGRAIIALGPAIIPYLIRQLKAGDFFFNVPLAAITHVDIASDRFNSEQSNSKAWIEWWEAGNSKPNR